MSMVMANGNLFDFFHHRVEEARAQRSSPISSETGLYLASLLVERARTDRPAPPESTLAELHARAAQSPPAEQARTYRELGDRALYLLGYFAESLERRPVGKDYYAEMGAAAYHRVDLVFKRWFADAFGPVFRELAVRFEDCVHLVEDVRDGVDGAAPADEIVRLYEKWLLTGSEVVAQRLRALGLVLPPSGHDA